MSENLNRGNLDRGKYDAMETEELEQILRLDAESPEDAESDTETLLYVMEVLAERRKQANVTRKTAQEAWESFQQNYHPAANTAPKSRKNRPAASWLRRILATAAVVALFICIPLTAKALNWEAVWNLVARWAKDTFSFVSSEETQITEPSKEDDLGYSSLQDMLKRNNRDYSMVPTWVPEGFVLEDTEISFTPLQEIYSALYACDEKQFSIRVHKHPSEDYQKVEINEEIIEIFTHSNQNYYIFSNNKQYRVVWTHGQYECLISGNLTIDEIKLMINSIGKG